ncbi:MAG: hypothetical protein ETSY2_11475 [Candidatus Entotheonella gemina]|uniref:Uncharacterized protein n=1 Tax=Candidatus Entotheonella gemina TaxID=1429439 RepID=W4MB14_9BACT|nr:MAG: hypothetical protein ETSY2_11475 [Candidatus Entotheonella gemina]
MEGAALLIALFYRYLFYGYRILAQAFLTNNCHWVAIT